LPRWAESELAPASAKNSSPRDKERIRFPCQSDATAATEKLLSPEFTDQAMSL
jgi:hypothetical protein